MMGQNEGDRLKNCLERKLHCSVTYMSEGYYLVRVPDGTTEAPNPKPDPRYREKTVIMLPDGIILKKAMNYPCIRPGCTHIRLLLPDELEGNQRRIPYGNY